MTATALAAVVIVGGALWGTDLTILAFFLVEGSIILGVAVGLTWGAMWARRTEPDEWAKQWSGGAFDRRTMRRMAAGVGLRTAAVLVPVTMLLSFVHAIRV